MSGDAPHHIIRWNVKNSVTLVDNELDRVYPDSPGFSGKITDH
jgi:hypothetical protein